MNGAHPLKPAQPHAQADSKQSEDQDDLSAFEQIVRRRRSVRHFRPDPLPDGLLERLLDSARWAPSGYNLQPTHFVVATDAALKARLHRACMGQAQILEAPASVIFCGDRNVAGSNFERVLEQDQAAEAVNAEYARLLRRFVPLAFSHGPLGVGWLWKALLLPLARCFVPVPSIPVVEKRYWLAKQVGLSAMVFLLAADAAGLATVPMEGFDESRVRSILKMPSSVTPMIIVPVGYSAVGALRKTRLPLTGMLHFNRW